jgi:hypothetical protein
MASWRTRRSTFNTNRDGWYWYAEDVRVETLWSAAAARGLTTASVNWSVTVADRQIDYLIPEFWRAVNDEDGVVARAEPPMKACSNVWKRSSACS